MGKPRRPKLAQYDVGYRRPPKEGQFKPGKSGNPKGRPTGRRSVGALLQAILQQRIPVTEGSKTRKADVLEVILRRLANDSMRSNRHAIKLLLTLVDRYAESSESAVQLKELLAEDQAILKRYLPPSDPPTADLDPHYRKKVEGISGA